VPPILHASKQSRAETLEPFIRTAVRRWYHTRFSRNFFSETNEALPVVTDVIRQWIGHILISRATNIVASPTSTVHIRGQRRPSVGAFPITLFINSHALQIVLPRVASTVQWNFTVANDVYIRVVKELELSLYYYVVSTGVSKRWLVVPDSEGPFAFPIVEPGVEDYQGVSTLAANIGRVQLLSKKAIAAMLMIDFWNPMYSARRLTLLKYLPESATLDKNNTYDVLPQFISNVKASSESADERTPEYEILRLLNEPDDTWAETFTKRVNDYLGRVHARLRGDGRAEATEDYMILAEGRRRLYRHWENSKPNGRGLDRFRMTLPIAARPDDFPLYEMRETGDTVLVQPAECDRIVMHCRSLNGGNIELDSPETTHLLETHSSEGCPAHYRED